jgi:hypothetical protein
VPGPAVAHRRGGVPELAGELGEQLAVVAHRRGQPSPPRRQRLGRRRLERGGSLGAEGLLEDPNAGTAVGDGVVHLEHEGHPTVGEALHQPELPERLGAVEAEAGDLRHDLVELLGPARARHRRPSYVVLDVEVGLVHPHRTAEAHRDVDQLPAQRRDAGQDLGGPLPRVPDGDRWRGRGGVDDRDLHRVHVLDRALFQHVERVAARQLPHPERDPR